MAFNASAHESTFGFGTFLRDNLIAQRAFNGQKVLSTDTEEIEVRAILYVLELAKVHWFSKIYLCSVPLKVINAIKGGKDWIVQLLVLSILSCWSLFSIF